MSIKILTYGALPKRVGGKLETGLANVIWQIADGINSRKEDLFINEILTLSFRTFKERINNTNIYGFSILRLLFFSVSKINIVLIHLINAKRISNKYNLNILKTFIELFFLEYGYSTTNPDIIHLHGILIYPLIKKTTFINKVKIVLTIHGIIGLDPEIEKSSDYKKIEQELTLEDSLNLIFVSSSIIQTWESSYGKLHSPFKVILNGVNKNIFFNNNNYISSKLIKLVCIGSFCERKGQLRIIQALKESALANKFSLTLIGGTGNAKYALKVDELINCSELQISKTGILSPEEVAKVLNNSDYMILPSSSEGFGLVYIESIMCGTPVILPRHLPLVKEAGVLNKENCILLKDHSSESILQVLINIDKFNFDRYKVSETCKQLTEENTIINYLDFFSSLLKINK